METRARLAAVGFWASNGRPCFSLFLVCTLFGGGHEKNETRFHMRTPKKERGITQGFFTIASKPNAFLCVFSFSLSPFCCLFGRALGIVPSTAKRNAQKESERALKKMDDPMDVDVDQTAAMLAGIDLDRMRVDDQDEIIIQEDDVEPETAPRNKRKRGNDDDEDGNVAEGERIRPAKRAPAGAVAQFRAFSHVAKYIKKNALSIADAVIFKVKPTNGIVTFMSKKSIDKLIGKDDAKKRPLDELIPRIMDLKSNLVPVWFGDDNVLKIPRSNIPPAPGVVNMNRAGVNLPVATNHSVFGNTACICYGVSRTQNGSVVSIPKLVLRVGDGTWSIYHADLKDKLDAFTALHDLHASKNSVDLGVVLRLEHLLSDILRFFMTEIVDGCALPLFLNSPVTLTYWSKLFERIPMGTLLRADQMRVKMLQGINFRQNPGDPSVFLQSYSAKNAYKVKVGNSTRETMARIPSTSTNPLPNDPSNVYIYNMIRRRSLTDMWAILATRPTFKPGKKPEAAKSKIAIMDEQVMFSMDMPTLRPTVLGAQALPNGPAHMIWKLFEAISGDLVAKSTPRIDPETGAFVIDNEGKLDYPDSTYRALLRTFPSVAQHLRTAAQEIVKNAPRENLDTMVRLARRDVGRPLNDAEDTALTQQLSEQLTQPFAKKIASIATAWGLYPSELLDATNNDATLDMETWVKAQREFVVKTMTMYTSAKVSYDIAIAVSEQSDTLDIIPWMIANNMKKAEIVVATRNMAVKRVGASTVAACDLARMMPASRQFISSVPVEWLYLRLARNIPTYSADLADVQQIDPAWPLVRHGEQGFKPYGRAIVAHAIRGDARWTLYKDLNTYLKAVVRDENLLFRDYQLFRHDVTTAEGMVQYFKAQNALFPGNLFTFNPSTATASNTTWSQEYSLHATRPVLKILFSKLRPRATALLIEQLRYLLLSTNPMNKTTWFDLRVNKSLRHSQSNPISRTLKALALVVAIATLCNDIVDDIVMHFPTADGQRVEKRDAERFRAMPDAIFDVFGNSVYRTDEDELKCVAALVAKIPARMAEVMPKIYPVPMDRNALHAYKGATLQFSHEMDHNYAAEIDRAFDRVEANGQPNDREVIDLTGSDN